MPTVTMRQIAKAAGVSPMTVSRALKDNPRLSQATRAKVQQVARSLGYKPHPYVSALMSGLARKNRQASSVNLAILHFSPFAQTKHHAFYRGICERARSLGYTPEPFHYAPERVSPERLRRILLSRGIRGIILMPASEGFTSIDFDFAGFASAALGHTVINPPLPRVASDIYKGTFRALDELVRRGYTRIGMINTDYVNRLGDFLHTAALMAYRRHVAPQLHLVDYTVEDPLLATASLEKMKRWILAEKLDAIVSPTFDFPLHQILKEQGFDIPRKLAYLHLIDYPDPQVSCMEQMGELMGAKAVDLVSAMINRNEFSLPEYPQVVGTLNRLHEGRTAPFLQKR